MAQSKQAERERRQAEQDAVEAFSEFHDDNHLFFCPDPDLVLDLDPDFDLGPFNCPHVKGNHVEHAGWCQEHACREPYRGHRLQDPLYHHHDDLDGCWLEQEQEQDQDQDQLPSLHRHHHQGCSSTVHSEDLAYEQHHGTMPSIVVEPCPPSQPLASHPSHFPPSSSSQQAKSLAEMAGAVPKAKKKTEDKQREKEKRRKKYRRKRGQARHWDRGRGKWCPDGTVTETEEGDARTLLLPPPCSRSDSARATAR